MNVRHSRSALLALAIGVALTAGIIPAVSGAQTAPQQLPANPQPNRPPPPQSQFDRGDPRGFDRRGDRFEEQLERRLDFLRSELRINPSQEQLWNTFADAVRRESELGRGQALDRRDALRGPDGRFEPPSIVERLERRQQAMEERGERYERFLSALRPLYAALNDEQRRAADEHLFAPGREGFGRYGQRRFGLNRLGRDFYGPFDRPFGPLDRRFGPLDRRYDRFDRPYR